MSGHSKWSQIKRQKQAGDVKRGLIFSKLANTIALAVRQSGGVDNPAANFRLRLAIDRAKAENMPKENIERAIERGLGSGKEGIEEVIFEGFGPGGVALLIVAVTDNHLRSLQYVKSTLEHGGGSLAGRGATLYLFEHLGQIMVELGARSQNELLDVATEADATDVALDGSLAVIYTQPDKLHLVKDAMLSKGFTVIEAKLIYRPLSPTTVSDETISQRVQELVSVLEDNPDIQEVFVSAALPNT